MSLLIHAASPTAQPQTATDSFALPVFLFAVSRIFHARGLGPGDRAHTADAIALLTKMYPPQDTKRECVFCGNKFVSGGSSTCTVNHKVDEFGDYEQTHKGHPCGDYGTFSGDCSRCRETIEADGPEDDGPEDTTDLGECYCGPHSSNKSDLKAFRIEKMGQAEHDAYFGSGDAGYKCVPMHS